MKMLCAVRTDKKEITSHKRNREHFSPIVAVVVDEAIKENRSNQTEWRVQNESRGKRSKKMCAPWAPPFYISFCHKGY